MLETQVDEIFLLGLNTELASMEECRNQPRSKGIDGYFMWVGEVHEYS